MILDQELRWKDQVNCAFTKGTKWVTQYQRLARVSGSVSAKYMRRFYLAVAVPRMLYAADVFLIPQTKHSAGMRGYIRKLTRVQRQAALHITGAMRTSPTDSLDVHADLLLFQLLVEKVLHRAAVRLATLPVLHPLMRHVNKAVR